LISINVAHDVAEIDAEVREELTEIGNE